jgi:hypothetical protein
MPSGGDEPPLPALPDYARPASTALDINAALKRLYEDASARKPGTAGQVWRLTDLLKDLEKLDSFIERLGPGLGDKDIRNAALRYRALAWLHAWVTLGELAERTSLPGVEGPRARLVGCDGGSALGLLLSIYAQMRQAEGDDEPLRKRLADGTHFVFLLGYRKPWKDDKEKGKIEHRYYIPSAKDLIGEPSDPPERNKSRRLMTLWALVNLQLDTWHGLAVDPLTVPPASDPTIRPGSTPKLKLLADWLSALHTKKNEDLLSKFDQKGARRGSDLSARADKLARFLRFRQEYADETKLASLLKWLKHRRLTPKTAGTNPRFDDLVLAAQPLGGGRLHDAAVWLRYVLLLSYRTQRGLLLDEGDDGLPKQWAKLSTGLDWKFDRPAPPAGRGGFLRWDRPPDNGHATAVLADLSRAGIAYLEFEKQVRALEKERFQAAPVSRPDAAKRYADALEGKLSPLQAASDRFLKPYFAAPGTILQWADPRVLTGPGDDGARVFRTSATNKEQGRLAGDLAALAGEYQTALRLHGLIRDACRSKDPEAVATSLRLAGGLGGLGGLSEWNVHALPRKPFKVYHDDLKEKIKELDKGVKAVDVERELIDAFTDRQKRFEGAQIDLAAARFGREIAEKAIELSKTYRKIAELDIEIEELGVRIAKLDEQAKNNQKEAAGLKLTYATRMRDLAEARVAALGQAVEGAKELAEKAGKDLEDLAASFKEAAKKFREERARARAFGILKAVISVVGAVLAPFTGGASLMVAALVVTAVDVYKKVDETNWKNFGDAVEAVGDIATQAGGAVKLGLNKFGGAKGKELFSKAQTYFNSARDKVQDVAKLKGELQPLFDQLKALKNGEGAARFASAVANGFPLTHKDGGFKIEFGKQQMKLPPGVQDSLKTILLSGGHILNDARARAQGLSNLPELGNAELREKLKQALEGAVRELPKEVREKLAGGAKEIENGKKALVASLDKLTDEEVRRLAHALAGGLLFTWDGKAVVAVPRSISEETKRLQGRLEAFKKKNLENALKPVVDKFEKLRKDLETKGQQLIDKKNDGGLNKLAGEIPTIVNNMKTQVVDEVKTKLAEAEDELEDKKGLERIVNYEARAADLLAEAAGLSVDQAERRLRRSLLGREAARLSFEINELGDKYAETRVRAAQRALEIAETDLRRAYDACLIRGINPRAPKGRRDVNSLGAGAEVRFRGLLAGYSDAEDTHRRLVLDRMAGDVVGMIQWVHLLRLTPDKDARTPVDWYVQMIGVVNDRQKPLYLDEKAKPEAHVVGELLAIADQLDKLFSDKAAERTRVETATGKVAFARIDWLDRIGDFERRRLRELFPLGERRESLLGSFRFRLTTDRPDADRVHPFADYDIPAEGGLYDHYVDLSEIYMVSEARKLSFLILPPLTSEMNTTWYRYRSPSDKNTEINVLGEDLKGILNSPLDKIVADRMKAKLGKEWKNKLGLTEGLGDWTVYIFANGVKNEEARNKVIKQLEKDNFEVGLKMFYLKVKKK